ncbi:MAG TPA: adenylate/guanylate cyclase domain-containing protein, partial [Gemmatimonadaceae bacterium]|nr:adenylate/guanylate cyclase domain-containing protein [Gemmatimonadaceae bacterium]
GVTVLFGAPMKSEPADQALAAARTALLMRNLLNDLSASWRKRGVSGSLEMRAGIQTGFSTVGVFGTDVLRRYTAVGTPVVVADALKADADPGTIVCGSATQALLGDDGDFVATNRGSRSLGLARPIVSYEIGRADGRSRQQKLPREEAFFFMPR